MTGGVDAARSRSSVASAPSMRTVIVLAALTTLTIALFAATLMFGSVDVPLPHVIGILVGGEAEDSAWRTIVIDLRLPRALTAALCGAALALSGLQMQTVFRNPLADPFILGVSAGAGLGVALVIFTGAGATAAFAAGGLLGNSSMVVAAALGAAAVLGVMLVIAGWTRDPVVTLIIGVVVGSLVNAVVTIFIYFADDARTRSFIEWGFGSFQRLTWDELQVFIPVMCAGLLLATATVKPLNALLLGDGYARSMGISVGRARMAIIATSAVLAGTVVAYAGPIAFLGIAVPHIARGALRTADHTRLLPVCLLAGASLGLVCGLLAELPGTSLSLPLNAATALIGAPIVVWVLIRLRRGTAG
jgi:iron complex transport system permease protein